MSSIEVVLKQPNPLFEKWLQEWIDEAKAKNLRSANKLCIALDSLKSFPLPLMSGRECAILRGFGATLCSLLDQKLEEYKKVDSEGFNKSLNYKAEVATVAKLVKEKQKKNPSVPKKKQSPVKNKKTLNKPNNNNDNSEEQIIMNPANFKIILVVDTQETNGKNKTTLDETRSYLETKNILFEIRRLSIGDFAWICKDNNNNELILPYIVERKRMDDLASSIRDGRFHEQKFRLKNSGIHNIIYLIENYGNNVHIGLPLPNLMQAVINTQVHSGFQIKFTDKHRESMFYITTLTRILIEKYKNKTLISIEKEDLKECSPDALIIPLLKFSEVQEKSSKTRNVRVKEIFIKQLLQLKSLSLDKALAITQVYPTPKSLVLAYQNCVDSDEAEKLLSKIPSGKLKRPIGLQISKIIYQFYNIKF